MVNVSCVVCHTSALLKIKENLLPYGPIGFLIERRCLGRYEPWQFVKSYRLLVSQKQDTSLIREALADIYPYGKRAVLFSVFTNILVLTPSLYMLQVYDRVVNSRSHTTLLMLTILVIGAYVFLEMLEWVRGQVMQNAGKELDKRLREPVFSAMFAAKLRGSPGNGSQALKDLKTVVDFLSSRTVLSLIDAPLAVMVLVLIFLIQPELGGFASAGALVLLGIGLLNERRIRAPLKAANQSAVAAQTYARGVIRNAQVIESMGMLDHIHDRWLKIQKDSVGNQATASDYAGSNAALSKLIQSLQGSLILGFGAWFAIRGELGGGLMIVASILGGRALAPLVQLIASWRQVLEARNAYDRLDDLLQAFPEPEDTMKLPPPQGRLSVEGVIASPPQTQLQILKGVSFRLPPGGSMAVVGPSASGKTSLARLLVGVWTPTYGKVRLDGSDISVWNKEELGPYVGYLPQNVELFDGTIAENVARFGEIDEEKVREACRMAGIEAMVGNLSQGYDTQIGEDGAFLSGGQRQGIALARAVYGDPRFVVLDEPDSSLDEAGNAALLHAIGQLKEKGATVIVITHRKNMLKVLDNMLVLVDGRVHKFGPRNEVLAALQSGNASATGKKAGGAA